MTASVFKYPVAWGDLVRIDMPESAQILSAQTQGPYESLAIWALVDPNAPLIARTFRIAGTGHPIEEAVTFIDTVQLQDGSLVFHVFEVMKEG